MNPLVRAQLKQIEQAVAALGEVLAEQREEVNRLQGAREELQKQVWSRSKEVAVLQEAASDYADLKRANAGYLERQEQLEGHLRKILAYTRALSEEVRQ